MVVSITVLLAVQLLLVGNYVVATADSPDQSPPEATITEGSLTNIDRADWHYGGDFPPQLPEEAGGTHIGIYLAWIVQSGLGSEKLRQYAGAEYDRLRRREISGRDLLFARLDGKFFPELLTEEGRSFTKAYYESNVYFEDYETALGSNLESLYHAEDSWANYDKLKPILDERLKAWRTGTQ